MSSAISNLADLTGKPIRPIHFWQHWRAAASTLRAYQPGTDAFVDQIRSAGRLQRLAFEYLLAPIYFGLEQGWTIWGKRNEMAAIMYLRRGARQGLRVMHIDDISVGIRYRRLGLAQRLMTLAEELAIQEHRPFLKLAVTVSNTSATTLYRRLGYQEQHHHYFTWRPSLTASQPTAASTSILLRRIRPRQAAHLFQQFYRAELTASVPTLADLLVAYYPGGSGLTGLPLRGKRSYMVLQEGKPVGYSDLFRKGARWNLRLSMHPHWWGTETERHVIYQLAGAIGHKDVAEIDLYVPSAAHLDAVRTSLQVPAGEPGLTEQSFDRMIMVKSLIP